MIRILVPLDGSTLAEQALIHALAIAKTFPAELTLLRVVADSDTGSAIRIDSVDSALWRRQAQAYLSKLANGYATSDLSIQCEISEGDPAESITKFIGERDSDLIVLTRYGRGNAEDFATGGTAQKVVSNAGCAVLLIDPHIEAKTTSYRRIVIPVDDSKDSEYALAIGVMLAESHDASVLLVHVTEEPRLPRGIPITSYSRQVLNEMRRIIRCEADRRLRELCATIPDAVHADTQILISSNPPFAIDSTAEEFDSDLILLCARLPDEQQGWRYGTVIRSLLQYSHRPLLIMQPATDGQAGCNFRSVYLDEQRLDVG